MPFFGLVQPKCDHCGYRCGEMFHQGWRHSDYPGFVFGRKKCLVEYVRAHPKEIAILNLKTNMKSKTEYTQIEADAIKELLRKKSLASRYEQKAIRGIIRNKYQFYISDFVRSNRGFNQSDFDRLIKIGRIKIVDHQNPVLKRKNISTRSKPSINKISPKPVKPDFPILKSNQNNITWEISQSASDSILAEGIEILRSTNKQSFEEIQSKGYGNYLISNSDEPFYIGEAKNLNRRLKQHSRERTSTFYKNYLKKLGASAFLEINDFDIQILENKIGRKEIEEFGIVNIPTILNKFQKGKRERFSGNASKETWIKVQDYSGQLLAGGEQALLMLDPIPWFEANIPNNAGLYHVEHGDNGLIYIGESSNIKERYDTHSGTTYFSALRRHIGTDVLEFELHVRNGKKRYFAESEDKEINKYLHNCKIKAMKVNFGRFELEEYLIRKYRPLLNRKENK